MKNLIIFNLAKVFDLCKVILIILCTVSTLFTGEPNETDWRHWSSGSAYLLPAGRWEVGVFQSLRYGYSASLELSTHPLAFLVMPNFNVKWSHGCYRGFNLSTRHSGYYPTPLLRNIARKGTGGIISPEFHIPHLVSIYNEVLISKSIAKGHLFTGKAGFCLAIKSGKLDERTTIDLPLVFPRLNVFYQGYGFRGGCNVEGKLVSRWNYLADADLFYYPSGDEKIAFEHKGLLLWTKNQRFQLCFGYKLTYGEYPFGTQWHLLGPLFD
ncbi:MAG: hypothetical protein ONB11_09580, partial [candidate division KSB1 bacterium]|nr:hypothetical protein [candidate division KSB1 bacterium]